MTSTTYITQNRLKTIENSVCDETKPINKRIEDAKYEGLWTQFKMFLDTIFCSGTLAKDLSLKHEQIGQIVSNLHEVVTILQSANIANLNDSKQRIIHNINFVNNLNIVKNENSGIQFKLIDTHDNKVKLESCSKKYGTTFSIEMRYNHELYQMLKKEMIIETIDSEGFRQVLTDDKQKDIKNRKPPKKRISKKTYFQDSITNQKIEPVNNPIGTTNNLINQSNIIKSEDSRTELKKTDATFLVEEEDHNTIKTDLITRPIYSEELRQGFTSNEQSLIQLPEKKVSEKIGRKVTSNYTIKEKIGTANTNMDVQIDTIGDKFNLLKIYPQIQGKECQSQQKPLLIELFKQANFSADEADFILKLENNKKCTLHPNNPTRNTLVNNAKNTYDYVKVNHTNTISILVNQFTNNETATGYQIRHILHQIISSKDFNHELNENWMSELLRKIPDFCNKKISEIVIPGSHDASTDKMLKEYPL